MHKASWFEIYVDNMDRAKEFYEKIFDVALEKMEDPTGETQMWSFPGDMNTYGAAGTLVKWEGFEAGKTSTIVYISCEDCAVVESRIVEAGGSVERPKFAIGESEFVSLFKDSEGNLVGLYSNQ